MCNTNVNSIVRSADGSLVELNDLTDVLCVWLGFERADFQMFNVRERNRYVAMLVDMKCIHFGIWVC